jgi:hypothetical protein
LPVATWRGITRRGKYLLLDFGNGHLLIHLGMSGSLRLVTAAQPAAKHDHLDLLFGPRDRPLILRLRDPRRFGAVLWLEGDVDAHPLLKVLGIEPLTEEFDALWLKAGTGGAEGRDQADLDGQPSHRRHRQHLRFGKPFPCRYRPTSRGGEHFAQATGDGWCRQSRRP